MVPKDTQLLGSAIDVLCEGITLQAIGVVASSSVGNTNNDLCFEEQETVRITGVGGCSSPTAARFSLQ